MLWVNEGLTRDLFLEKLNDVQACTPEPLSGDGAAKRPSTGLDVRVVVDPNVLLSTLIAPRGASDKAVRALPTGAALIVSEKLLAWPARTWLIQNITTPDDAWLSGRQVRDPLTAFAQAEIIEQA